MIQTVIIPQNNILSIDIPQNYIGKKVYALIYTDDEVTTNNIEAVIDTKSFDYKEAPNSEANDEVGKESKLPKISSLVSALTGVIPDVAVKSDDYYEYLTKKYS
jgi:hypothetical protein